jgi:hypothetical protein
MRSRISARPVVPKPAVFCDRSCLVAKRLPTLVSSGSDGIGAVKPHIVPNPRQNAAGQFNE